MKLDNINRLMIESVKVDLKANSSDIIVLKGVKALQDNGMDTLFENYMRWDIYGTCSSVAVR